MNRHIVELVAALAVGAVFTFGLGEAWSYRGQSSYMPVAATGLAVFLSILWAAQSARMIVAGAGGRYAVGAADFGAFAFVVAAAAVYVAGVIWIGFFTSTVVMVPAVAFALGYRNVVFAVLATVGFVAVLYAVFELLLAIPLPPEAILGVIGG